MKIALLNDTHRGLRNASSMFSDHQSKFYSEVFFPYMKDNGITAVLHLGDYFDNRKALNVRCLAEDYEQYIKPCEDLGIANTILVGNHDTFFRNTNHYNSLREVFRNKDSIRIIEDPTELTYGNITICAIPWINSENLDDAMALMGSSTSPVCVGHFEFTGFDMYRGIPARGGFNADALKHFGLVLSGHYHTKSSKGNVTYLGAQFEMNWSDCGDPKGFHVLDTETLKLEFVLNPNTLHEKIKYDDTVTDYRTIPSIDLLNQYKEKFIKVIRVNVSNNVAFDEFISRLSGVGAHEVRVLDPIEQTPIAESDDSPVEDIDVSDTIALIDTYIDDSPDVENKSTVKKIMTSLHRDALNAEV